jgi:hypothetical protein
MEEIIRTYHEFVDRLEGFGLPIAAFEPPRLDVSAKRILRNSRLMFLAVQQGKQVMRLFGVEKGGKVVADLLQLVLEWQLENPEGNHEELEAWLRGEWETRNMSVQPERKRQKSE